MILCSSAYLYLISAVLHELIHSSSQSTVDMAPWAITCTMCIRSLSVKGIVLSCGKWGWAIVNSALYSTTNWTSLCVDKLWNGCKWMSPWTTIVSETPLILKGHVTGPLVSDLLCVCVCACIDWVACLDYRGNTHGSLSASHSRYSSRMTFWTFISWSDEWYQMAVLCTLCMRDMQLE